MFPIFAGAEQLVRHVGSGDSTSGPSPRLLQKMLTQSQDAKGGRWVAFGDDFVNFGDVDGTSASSVQNGYGAYTDTATTDATIAQLAGVEGGAIQLSTSGTDNHECWLTTGGNNGGFLKAASGGSRALLFEARIRLGQVTEHGVFVGLAEEGLAAADTLTDDDGALASKDFIGFHIDTAGPTALDFVYRKAGSAAQVVSAGVQTVAASTWYKVGFIIDPDAPADKRLKIFIDNVEQGDYATKANLEASTFPSGEELAMLAGIKTGAAADKTLDLDWWYAAGQVEA